MLELRHAVPTDTISKLVPGARFEVLASSVKEWRQHEPDEVNTTCMFIWDEMVHRGRVKQPFKIAPVVNREFRGIYEFVQRELGAAPITQAFTLNAFGQDPDYSFADVSLVRCFPHDLHICDVEFADLSRPVAKSDPTRQYRRFHGLGLLAEFIDRVVEVARSQGAKRVSLMAAYPPLYEVFQKHGFSVSPTEMSQRAFNSTRTGFPMIREV